MKTSDQRVRLTKMLLRRALTELLKQKPVQSISVKELCEKAGIHRGTFYAHYTDIFDLLAQVEEEMMQDFSRRARAVTGGGKGRSYRQENYGGDFSLFKRKRRYLYGDVGTIRR